VARDRIWIPIRVLVSGLPNEWGLFGLIAGVIIVIAGVIIVIALAVTFSRGVDAVGDRPSQTGPVCRAQQRNDSSVFFRCRF